ncbi:MAG: PaaI family thioesterase [Actinobacteria bacterium]|nr:PaaI family thioesterase [Actinomycetota bacterium]
MTVGTPGWAEQLRRALDAEVTPHRQSMRRMGDSVRHLVERLMATTAPREALEEAAEVVDDVCRRLEAYPGGRVPEGFAEAANSGDPHAFFDNSPQIGRANPLAPPIVVHVEDDLVVGRVRFGSAYEGPPGCVHGGHVAAAFDEVLGMAQSLTGQPGMTGTLTVRYRRPTPLFTDLRYEARVERIEGRKIFTVGRSFHGDELTAEADAVFVRINFERIADLYDKRRRG